MPPRFTVIKHIGKHLLLGFDSNLLIVFCLGIGFNAGRTQSSPSTCVNFRLLGQTLIVSPVMGRRKQLVIVHIVFVYWENAWLACFVTILDSPSSWMLAHCILVLVFLWSLTYRRKSFIGLYYTSEIRNRWEVQVCNVCTVRRLRVNGTIVPIDLCEQSERCCETNACQSF